MTRKSMFTGLVVVAVVALGAAMVTSALAQQEQGRRGRGMMGAMMYLERSWTAVSFQLDCTGEQLELLRPTYRTALQTRADAVEASIEAQDWEGVRMAFTECKDSLDAKLQEVLTDEQWAQLEELMSAGMGMGGRRGGGAGGGN